MYQTFGAQKFIKFVLYINGALVLLLGSDALGFVPLLPGLRAVSASVLILSVLIFVVGQTRLFPWLCQFGPMWRAFPNIEGRYDVELASNWSVIENRTQALIATEPPPPLFKKAGRVTITARLFWIRIRLETDDGYLTSDTIQCGISKDEGAGNSILTYVYRSSVPVPQQTDSAVHYGAGRIEIPRAKHILEMRGTYWTDRNWHKGLNTAGYIKLSQRESA